MHATCIKFRVEYSYTENKHMTGVYHNESGYVGNYNNVYSQNNNWTLFTFLYICQYVKESRQTSIDQLHDILLLLNHLVYLMIVILICWSKSET